MKKTLFVLLITVVCGSYAAADAVTNGDFSAGLTGWSLVTQSTFANGTTNVDIDDAGPLGSSPAFFTSTEGGIGLNPTLLEQLVTLTGGTTYDFEGDFAAISAFNNLDFGRVTVSIGGNQIAFWDFGGSHNPEAFYEHLSGTFTPATDGAVALDIQFIREFEATDETPVNYADNISLTGGEAQPVTTPEPATLMLLGTGILGLVRRRVRAQ